MTKDEEKQILKDAVETFGIEKQLAMLQEECAELIAAVSHYNRGRCGALDNLIEEIADVSIMLDQISLAFDRDITPLRTWKLERLKARIIEKKLHPTQN
jgi:NTP pyrophosphatase (non-canonical NTP hydrolase)